MEPYPQVFVVDSQASIAPLPSRQHRRWGGICQRLLPLLVGLALLGLVVQSGCIYYLYKRTEVSVCEGVCVCEWVSVYVCEGGCVCVTVCVGREEV